MPGFFEHVYLISSPNAEDLLQRSENFQTRKTICTLDFLVCTLLATEIPKTFCRNQKFSPFFFLKKKFLIIFSRKNKKKINSRKHSTPLSQRQNSLNEYFSRIDFSEFVLLPVLWATSGLGLFFKYLVTQLTNQSLE